jgi:hypothetical protein
MKNIKIKIEFNLNPYKTITQFFGFILIIIFLWPSIKLELIHNNFYQLTRDGLKNFRDGFGKFKFLSPSWGLNTMLIDKSAAQELINYVKAFPEQEIFIFPRPVSLYVLANKKNPTRIYMFARYFSHTIEMQRMLKILESKKIKHIIVEESLAATAANQIYFYILKNYIKEKQIGPYIIYNRASKHSDQIIISKIVDSFSPETKSPEYIWANYMKTQQIGGLFDGFLFQHPPHARCIFWNYKEWLIDYKTLNIIWRNTPGLNQNGKVSIYGEFPLGWRIITTQSLVGADASANFSLQNISNADWIRLKFCTDMPNGSYLKVTANK